MAASMDLSGISVSTVVRGGGAALAVYVVSSLLAVVTAAVVKIPTDKLDALAKKRYGVKDSDQYPLRGKVAVITGSTNGLGEQMAIHMYRLGATVVIASRTFDKCVSTGKKIADMFPASCGQITPRALDTSDLESVRAFAQWFAKEFSRLDYLINNAGIVYLPSEPFPTPDAPLASKQGFDKCFATNFLGHYLLTELLLPVLKSTGDARIVVVASTAHLQVSGGALRCVGGAGPEAARSDVYTSAHWITAYGNSKLAQLLHFKTLSEQLQSSNDANGLKVVAVCPGFVNTGMVPDTPLGRFLAPRFYHVEAGAYVPLYAALAPDADVKSGEFLTNFYNAWSSSCVGRSVYKLCSLVGLRSYLVGVIGIPWVIAFQHTSYGIHRTPVSDVAQDTALAAGLYQWCQKIIRPYVSDEQLGGGKR